MKFKWCCLWAGCYIADVGPVSVSVHRAQGFKKYGIEKPWRIEVFGNQHGFDSFAEPEEAMREVEKIATRYAVEITELFGFVVREHVDSDPESW